MDTYFAPAARTERRKLKNQISDISHSPVMNSLLNAANGLLIVLNDDRQIVALNHTFLDALGIKDPEAALGLRLGESLHCVHAAAPPNGCGTTPHCETCGAAIAMMTAIEQNIPSEQICALTALQNGVTQDICLLVRAQPLTVDEKRWILLYAQDITQEQFWVALEHVFFHDINNLLSPIIGFSEMLASEFPDRNDIQQIRKTALRLTSEIALQRNLLQRKDAHYQAQKEKTSLQRIRSEVNLFVQGHNAANDKTLTESGPSQDRILCTDSMLVSRVLGNMLINALEATEAGGTITMTTKLGDTHVTWEIWNKCSISPAVQKRIFQRHFSTKSKIGRGLGTFSMKLFGEKYLGGEVSFRSTKEEGTTFQFRLPLT